MDEAEVHMPIGLKINKLSRTKPAPRFTSGTMSRWKWLQTIEQLEDPENPESAVVVVEKPQPQPGPRAGRPSHLKECYVLRTPHSVGVCLSGAGGLDININGKKDRNNQNRNQQLALPAPPPVQQESYAELPSPPPSPLPGKRRPGILRRVKESSYLAVRPKARINIKPIPNGSWEDGLSSLLSRHVSSGRSRKKGRVRIN